MTLLKSSEHQKINQGEWHSISTEWLHISTICIGKKHIWLCISTIFQTLQHFSTTTETGNDLISRLSAMVAGLFMYDVNLASSEGILVHGVRVNQQRGKNLQHRQTPPSRIFKNYSIKSKNKNQLLLQLPNPPRSQIQNRRNSQLHQIIKVIE